MPKLPNERAHDNGEFLLEAMATGSASAPILNQEARGQTALVNSTMLPRDMRGQREAFEAMGIVFGEDDGTDIFIEATLPEGWKKVADGGGAYWSYLVDERGRRRASIFYKAAFYDRIAHMSLSRRFRMTIELQDSNNYYSPQRSVVVDANKPRPVLVTEWKEHPGPEASREEVRSFFAEGDKQQEKCVAWLEEHYPEHNDVTAYWDE